jgi:DHA1 family bicyclomycin/chloramphenicol resistance-like MFS transporter
MSMMTKAGGQGGRRTINLWFFVAIVLMSTCAPFATDMYLPAFPAMTKDLAASAANIQMTLTAFFLGVAGGHLFWGPLSDRVGRRSPLLAGTGACVAFSLAVALAPNIEMLIAARFLQGLTGAAGMVLSRAIISDVAKGRAAARLFNVVGVAMGIAPIAAPVIGSIFAPITGWRGLFAIVMALNALAFIFSIVFVPETCPAQTAVKTEEKTIGKTGLASRAFVANTAILIPAFGVLMAYLSSSPFVFQTMMGTSELIYGLLLGLNSLFMVTMTYVAARLTRRFDTRKVLGIGAAAQIAAIALLAATVASNAPIVILAALFFFIIGSNGLIFGNATALALGAVPKAAGRGSAIIGVGQFVFGAAAAPLVGLGGEHTAVPLAIVMGACAAIMLAAFLCGKAKGQ